MENIVKEMEDAAQRTKNINFLIETRCDNMLYLKRMCDDHSKTRWLNVVLVPPKDLLKNVDESTIHKRTRMWFVLGVNLAPLIKIDNIPTYVRSLAQMMEEYDYYFSNFGNTMEPTKIREKKASINLDNAYEAVKPKLHKAGHIVSYEFLDVFNIPCELDYLEITSALCEVLKVAYSKFNDEACSNKHIYETIQKLDARLKSYFFGIVAKELHKLAKKTVREHTSDVDSVYKAWEAGN